jgi:hypothetical protein
MKSVGVAQRYNASEMNSFHEEELKPLGGAGRRHPLFAIAHIEKGETASKLPRPTYDVLTGISQIAACFSP